MDTEMYAIVFNGEVLAGFDVISVKAHLAKLLKADDSQMGKIFSGKQIVLKRTPDKALAIKLGTALKKVGANVSIRIVRSAPPENSKSAVKTEEAAVTEPATSLSVVPNRGYIFDPAPAVSAAEIDTAGLSAEAEWEGSLEPAREQIRLSLDLSDIQLAEPDERPLEEPRSDTVQVDAPDFSLDEPGAMLETLQPNVEKLQPDTSGLSLANPGSDLITDKEREVPPEPVVPDISKISLVPNNDQG